MEWMVKKLLQCRFLILALFIIGVVLSVGMTAMVQVNYDLTDYLPDGAASTVALNTMDAQYTKGVPNVRVMIPEVSIPQALLYKEKLKAIDGVEDVNWLDDQVDIKLPLEMLSQEVVKDWYAQGDALYSLVVDEGKQQRVLAEIRELIGDEGAMSGNPVDTVSAQNSTSAEIAHMMGIIIPMMFAILLFTTTSWFEPVLFMVGIGVSILLNMGSNLIFGEISFITQTTGSILQLACSMDYSVFLLDRFEELKAEGKPPMDAMAQAIVKSTSSILSSGLTTAVGFAALCVMRFKIGPDMGYVLAKAIGFSLLGTLVFLPCLTMCCYKLIDRTRHRSFMPQFHLFSKAALKARWGMLVCVLVVLPVAYLGQKQISFLYGMSGMSAPGSQVVIDRERINEQFGESTMFAMLVPQGELANEQALNDALKELPEVKNVLSYVENVGRSVPVEYLSREILEQLNSEEYTRLVITAQVPNESAQTFALVEKLRALGERYYGERYHLAGECANVYDMKQTILADTVKVNLLSIGAIGLILLVNFRSLLLPILLLLTIESSVFINLAVPYFRDVTLNYIGYLIISSVQLGATVDYAILLTNRYLENRAELHKKQAIQKTISDCAGSIMTSGFILAFAGFVLGFISTNGVISQLGILLARGALLSMLLVLIFLPALLTSLEPLVCVTTLKLNLKPKPDKVLPPLPAEKG